jgi:hypothetical protein
VNKASKDGCCEDETISVVKKMPFLRDIGGHIRKE